MNVSHRLVAIFLILILSVLFLQNCLTVTKGESQRIPVTSNLTDARVFVDGKEIGATPIHAVLKKNRDHVIRIERPGYDPVSIVMNRESSAASSGRLEAYNALAFFPIGFILAGGISSLFFDMGVHGSAGPYVIGAVGGVGLTLLAISTDKRSNARYGFSPAELKITLVKTGTQAREVNIVLTPERLNNIHWIRISYSGNDDRH
jgi:hypothetical protein